MTFYQWRQLPNELNGEIRVQISQQVDHMYRLEDKDLHL